MEVILIIVCFSIMVALHEFGHFLSAKAIGVFVQEFGIGFPPRLFSKKIGETVYSINAIPFGGFVKVYGSSHLEEHSGIEITRSFSHQSILRRLGVMAAGIFANFLIGWILLSVVFMIGAPKGIMVNDTVKGGVAAVAGIQKNDQILNLSAEEFINFVNANKGKEIIFDIKRGSDVLKIKLTPRKIVPTGEGNLGVIITDLGLPQEGFFKSFWSGLMMSLDLVKDIALGLVYLIIDIFKGVPGVLNSFVGPVGIVSFAAETAKIGLIQLIHLFAIISLNLAVLNIIPIPGLDGSQIALALAEKIRGKALKPKTELIVNGIGLLALFALMIVVTARDVWRLF
ncbi:MAG: site-2 protease family protein [Candidatus Pacebacteria bacterium]|nr:site-2 protease family protein [Candidatus Paceibacterota bacterium]